MKLQLPKYTSKDYVVLSMVLLPYTLGMNGVIFKAAYFSGPQYFLVATFVTAILFSVYFIICGGIAVLMKNRFPLASQVPRRLTIMILSFLTLSGIFLMLLFKLYAGIKYFAYSIDDDSFVWAYFGMGIGNVFLTFLHEGIDRYENWKKSQDEAEQLKDAYQQSRLLGLKSQVNPHFLFNSLNSLSSLISDDEEEAEIFLDEMSKVYRYMLRNEEDNLVSLATELKFLESYSYLLKARYGNGLQFRVNVQEEDKEKCLPPLTLQTIIENAFTQNAINKNNPLVIKIAVDENDTLVISNTVQPKLIKENFDIESGIDNLVNRYHLLGKELIAVQETKTERTIRLPLIIKNREVLL